MALRTVIGLDCEVRHCQEIQKHYWDEYQDYVARKPMTGEERSLLRRWVFQGNSVYDTPDGRRADVYGYPMAFIDAYREDFLRSIGDRHPSPELLEDDSEPSRESDSELWSRTPEEVRQYIRGLRNRITALMSYLAVDEDLCDVQDYLDRYERNAFQDTYWRDTAQDWPRPERAQERSESAVNPDELLQSAEDEE